MQFYFLCDSTCLSLSLKWQSDPALKLLNMNAPPMWRFKVRKSFTIGPLQIKFLILDIWSLQGWKNVQTIAVGPWFSVLKCFFVQFHSDVQNVISCFETKKTLRMKISDFQSFLLKLCQMKIHGEKLRRTNFQNNRQTDSAQNKWFISGGLEIFRF